MNLGKLHQSPCLLRKLNDIMQIWCLTHSRCSFNFNFFFRGIHQINFYETHTFTEITLTVWTNTLHDAP